MDHKIYKITSVAIQAPFSLEIIFENGLKKDICFSPILKGEMYGPLADESYFNMVYLDPDVHTITWPNGADFDPETLYNWDKYKDELIERSAVWVNVSH